MAGVLDWLFPAKKVLDKAAGAPAEQSVDCPHCGTGITQTDIAKSAQADADRMNAAKAKQAPAPAKKAAPKKTSSIGDMMQGYS